MISIGTRKIISCRSCQRIGLCSAKQVLLVAYLLACPSKGLHWPTTTIADKLLHMCGPFCVTRPGPSKTTSSNSHCPCLNQFPIIRGHFVLLTPMYIPAQCIPLEMPSPSDFRVLVNNVTPMVYDLEPRDRFKALCAAVVVAIAWLVLLAVIVRYAAIIKFQSSSLTVLGKSQFQRQQLRFQLFYLRIIMAHQGPGGPSAEITARSRKRLEKLDEVAPSQSLQDWRTTKMTTCVQDCITASNKLT